MFVGLDVLFGLNTPKLQVPTDFKVKNPKIRKIPFRKDFSSPIQGVT